MRTRQLKYVNWRYKYTLPIYTAIFQAVFSEDHLKLNTLYLAWNLANQGYFFFFLNHNDKTFYYCFSENKGIVESIALIYPTSHV